MFITVTQIKCRPGRRDEVLAFCQGLLAPTREEKGCLDFRLCQDDAASEVLVLVASWRSKADWQTHIDSPRQRELAARSESEEGKALVESLSSQHLHELA
ncbi:putative quinol monooxygenase [Pseudochelatococcus sp. B33]